MQIRNVLDSFYLDLDLKENYSHLLDYDFSSYIPSSLVHLL